MKVIFQDFGHVLAPHGRHVALWPETRALLARGVRKGTVDGDTGVMHGPVSAGCDGNANWPAVP